MLNHKFDNNTEEIMSYFKKTIKVIIIVLSLQYILFTFGNAESIFDPIYDLGLRLDNLLFCNKYFLPEDFNGLKKSLSEDVLGQPFVSKHLCKTIEDHFSKPHPKFRDPLLLSFHGSIGVGKSFVSQIISSVPFIKNKHLIPSRRDFSDPMIVEEYKTSINKLLKTAVTDCDRSMFIFDDADYIPPNLFNELEPFKHEAPTYKFSECMFIFIFQMGSLEIASITTHLLQKGLTREQFGIQPFRDMIAASMQQKDGFHESIFLKPFNKIIPFLPLEKEHIKEYIEIESAKDRYKPTKNDIEKVLEELEFEQGTSYSISGCKLAKSKLKMILNSRKTEL